jgi:hypothetical protein
MRTEDQVSGSSPDAGAEPAPLGDDDVELLSARVLPPLDELQQMHRKLVLTYVRAVNEASRLPFLVTKRWWEEHRSSPEANLVAKPGWLASGTIARWLVESHIKRKVSDVNSAYRRLEAVLSPEQQEYAEWLAKTRVSLDTLARSFSSFYRVRIAAATVWPLITSLVVEVSFPSLLDPLPFPIILLVLILLLFYLGPFVYIGLRSSFKLKRDLLLPGASYFDRPSLRSGRQAIQDALSGYGWNAYEAEDELFGALGRAKHRELPLDAIADVAVILVPAAVFVALIEGRTAGDFSWVQVIVATIAFMTATALFYIRTGGRRHARRSSEPAMD